MSLRAGCAGACPYCAVARRSELAAQELRVCESVDLQEVTFTGGFKCAACIAMELPSARCLRRPCAACSDPGFTGATEYLKSCQRFSQEQLRLFMAEVFWLKISEGGLVNLMKRGAEALSYQIRMIRA